MRISGKEIDVAKLVSKDKLLEELLLPASRQTCSSETSYVCID